MKAFLLAAGYGTRLKPITDTIPKCMVPICGQPLLGWWFDLLRKHGITDVLVNTHYLPEPVREFMWAYNAKETGLIAHETYEPELLGSGGTIRANRGFVECEKDFLICYADNLTDADLTSFQRFHEEQGTLLTMALFRTNIPEQCGIAELNDKERIIAFEEKPEHPKSNLANAGMYIANSRIFDYTKYCIPALMFAWLYKEKTNLKLRPYFLVVGIILSAILVFAGGFALAISGMLIVYIFLKNWTRVFNYFSYWALHIIFFVAVNMLKIQNLFLWLIDGILGKLRSFETRMLLWEKTIQFISDSPLIGHGMQSSTVRITEYQLSYGIHAHNMLLEIFYQSGTIGFILWSILVLCAGYNVYRNRNTTESKIISTAFLGWCITTLVEPFTTPFFMGMFIIAYRSNKTEAVPARLATSRALGKIRFKHRGFSSQSGVRI